MVGKISKKAVRVKPNSYQPTKAEVEELFKAPRKPDGTHFTLEEAAERLLRPVTLVKDPEA